MCSAYLQEDRTQYLKKTKHVQTTRAKNPDLKHTRLKKYILLHNLKCDRVDSAQIVASQPDD